MKQLKVCGIKPVKGRCHYGHLGGKTDERLFARLIEMEWLKLEEGKPTVYEITGKGYEEFGKMGAKLD